MTLSDLHPLHTVDLPSLVSHPEVRTEHVTALELDQCSFCPNQHDHTPKPGVYRIAFHHWNCGELFYDVCSPECGDGELADLLRRRPDPKDQPTNIRVLVSQRSAPSLPVPDEDSDPIWQAIDGLRRYVATVPGTDVDTFRAKVLAAVESVVVTRLEQLGRAA